MVKNTRVCPNIMISTTDGSAITAARPTSRPTPDQPSVSSTWTRASLEQTSGSSAPPATTDAHRPAISADPGDSAAPLASCGCAPIVPIAPAATAR